jgi:hypothetical protein
MCKDFCADVYFYHNLIAIQIHFAFHFTKSLRLNLTSCSLWSNYAFPQLTGPAQSQSSTFILFYSQSICFSLPTPKSLDNWPINASFRFASHYSSSISLLYFIFIPSSSLPWSLRITEMRQRLTQKQSINSASNKKEKMQPEEKWLFTRLLHYCFSLIKFRWVV